jgi:hypothetical protein
MAEGWYTNCHYVECHYAECHYAECHYAECHNGECIMLNVIMLSVVMVCVVAPLKPHFGIHGWWHLPGLSKDANLKFGFLDSDCL